MRILAIETSGRSGSVATLEGGAAETRLVTQTVLGTGCRTAQSLAPTIQEVLRQAHWPVNSIGLVAVAIGPGSFTGLRIGVTTAKALAYAIEAEVAAVNTLAALAAPVPPTDVPLWTVVDAQRQELFAARFTPASSGLWEPRGPTSIVPQDEWLNALETGDQVTGPALQRLAPRLPGGVDAVPEQFWQPMAAAVGQVAWRQYSAGQRDDLWRLVPVYYRPSAAEEKESRATRPESRAESP